MTTALKSKNEIEMDSLREDILKLQAMSMALVCVRNTSIEDIHSGEKPQSRSGDFSDVKVVTPTGEIPWREVSRITNDEIRDFMKQVVDRIYTVLLRADDPEFMARMVHYAQRPTHGWDAPKNLTDWFTGKWDKPSDTNGS